MIAVFLGQWLLLPFLMDSPAAGPEPPAGRRASLGSRTRPQFSLNSDRRNPGIASVMGLIEGSFSLGHRWRRRPQRFLRSIASAEGPRNRNPGRSIEAPSRS